MNRSRLPPLNALRAFEAAARHLSVKVAAEELSVTPGAVSQMIRTLETHLGVQLFERVNRGILLTAAGRDYLPPVRNAFRQIADASQRVSGAADSGVLTVSVTPFFASAWLVPRLAQFREACPDVDLQVVTSHALADFSRDGVDVAIRHGLGRYIGLCSERLLTVEIVALASPELVARLGMPATPADLVGWPQLHDAERKGWHIWFGAQRIVMLGLVILAGAGLFGMSGVDLTHFYGTLILLGLGWNFGFIGATAMLTSAYSPSERGRVQGMNDSIVMGCVTVASLASGGLMNCAVGSAAEGWQLVNLAMAPFLVLAGGALIWLAMRPRLA